MKSETEEKPRALCGAVIWREAMSSGQFFAFPCKKQLGHPGEHSLFPDPPKIILEQNET